MERWIGIIVGALVAVLLGGGLLILIVSGGPVDYIDDSAQQRLMAEMGAVSVTVYPAWIRSGVRTEEFDITAGAEIAGFLRNAPVGDVEIGSADAMHLNAIAHRNEQRVAMATAQSFAAYIAGSGISTDYALLPEYFIGAEGAVAVHYYWVSAAGEVAYAATINDHHKIFQNVNPKTPEDCTQIVIAHMEQWL